MSDEGNKKRRHDEQAYNGRSVYRLPSRERSWFGNSQTFPSGDCASLARWHPAPNERAAVADCWDRTLHVKFCALARDSESVAIGISVSDCRWADDLRDDSHLHL